MTKPLPLNVGDRAYCKVCQEVVVITKIVGDRIFHTTGGTDPGLPRNHYRKMPDRKEG